MTIEIKNAVESVIKYLEESNFKTYFGEEIKDTRLEEVELSEDEKFWLITLSFKVVDDNPSTKAFDPSTVFNKINYKREYKIFEVNAETGKVKSMKIRKI